MDFYNMILNKGIKEMSNSVAYLIVNPIYKATSASHLKKGRELMQKVKNEPDNLRIYEQAMLHLQDAFKQSLDECKIDVIFAIIQLNIYTNKKDMVTRYVTLLREQQLSEYTISAMKKGWDDPTGFKTIYRTIVALIGNGPTDKERIEARIQRFNSYKIDIEKQVDFLLAK